MDEFPSGYVITAPFGGSFDLDAIQSNLGPSTCKGKDKEVEVRVWPKVPVSYGPPSVNQEHAVKEVAFISNLLKAHTELRPNDDVECIQDLILSLETRTDITKHVLLITKAPQALTRLMKSWKTHERRELVALSARANALLKHWGNNLNNEKGDEPVRPLLTTFPDNKHSNWKLELSDKASEMADKLLNAIKKERKYSQVYLNENPPTPITWHPINQDAWRNTTKAELQGGDLYYSHDWAPIYMDYGLATLMIPFSWRTEKWSAEENEEYQECRRFVSLGCADSMREVDIRKGDLVKSA